MSEPFKMFSLDIWLDENYPKLKQTLKQITPFRRHSFGCYTLLVFTIGQQHEKSIENRPIISFQLDTCNELL